jgi:hypothetical protein
MTLTRRLFSILGLAAAVGLTAAFAPAETATIGKQTPPFVSDDVMTGKPFKIVECTGDITVLEWINPDCPVCKRVYEKGVITKTIERLRAIDPKIRYVTINSTATRDGKPVTKDQVTSQTKQFLTQMKMNVPAIVDFDGTVGKVYGAKTTPHMFVIDAKGILRYTGALDDDKNGKKAESGQTVTNYVVEAVKKIKANETVTPDTTEPYGCSVKYATAAAAAD